MKQRNPRMLRFLGVGFFLLLGCFGLFCIKKGWTVPCPFFSNTGLRCPSCGTTRAIAALLAGDLSKALSYNLVFPAQLALLLVLIPRLCFWPHLSKAGVLLLAVSVLALVAWTILRNIFGI